MFIDEFNATGLVFHIRGRFGGPKTLVDLRAIDVRENHMAFGELADKCQPFLPAHNRPAAHYNTVAKGR